MSTLPFQKGNAASLAAAKSFQKKAPGARRRVFDYIRANPRSTDKDQQTGLSMNPNTQRPRRIELENAGHIRPDGVDTKGTGRVVFVLTDKPYPKKPPKGYWKSSMRAVRAVQPTPQEFTEAVKVLKQARKVLGKFPPEALKVFRWIAKQAK